MGATPGGVTLPPQSQDNVVEVEPRHVILAFSGIIAATFLSGAALIVIRDYMRFRRQKAILETLGRWIPRPLTPPITTEPGLEAGPRPDRS